MGNFVESHSVSGIIGVPAGYVGHDQTADAFLVTAATVASWMNRLDEASPNAIVQLRTPVNKFPEFVRYAVQRLTTLCPTLGKKKLAEVLARAGLHLGATTVGRMRKEPPKTQSPSPSAVKTIEPAAEKAGRVVTAKRPNHVWHVDLTMVPTQMGMWCSWSPWALPQYWPFCWWLALVLDHHSRRMMGLAVYWGPPSSVEIRTFLGRVIHAAGTAPKYLISDKGCQYWPSAGYKRWCKRWNIRPRFGAIGKHGSIAVLERGIRTLKELLPQGDRIPYRVGELRQLIRLLIGWYNEHRPHTTLKGATPEEIYFKRFPANRKPRIEPRPNWPRPSPCARPHALVGGDPGARFNIEVEHVDGQPQLPIIRLRRAA